jgi:hypothetical protein
MYTYIYEMHTQIATEGHTSGVEKIYAQILAIYRQGGDHRQTDTPLDVFRHAENLW